MGLAAEPDPGEGLDHDPRARAVVDQPTGARAVVGQERATSGLTAGLALIVALVWTGPEVMRSRCGGPREGGRGFRSRPSLRM